MSLLIASIIYSSTVFGFTNHLLMLLVVPLFIKRREVFKYERHEFQFLVLISFVALLSVVNNVIGFVFSGSISFPFFVFTIFSFICYKLIDRKVLCYILLFVCVELALAIVQYVFGVSSFSMIGQSYNEFTSDALYYRKSAGLSSSSSVLAYKILIAFIVSDYLIDDGNGKRKIVLYAILVAGLYVTFNRTVIFSVLVFLAIAYSGFVLSFIKTRRGLFVMLPAVMLVMLFLVPLLYDFLALQFARGDASKGVDLSGRAFVWKDYIDFIIANPVLGNFSGKYISEISVPGYGLHQFHAHNSFLMLFSSQGILIGFMFLIVVLSKLNRFNFKYMMPLFVYSFAQYGMFWGLSFFDIFAFYFLMSSRAGQVQVLSGNCGSRFRENHLGRIS